MDAKRVNLNIPTETLEKIDAYADQMTITRTAAVLVLVNQALEQKAALADLSAMVNMLGTFSPDSLKSGKKNSAPSLIGAELCTNVQQRGAMKPKKSDFKQSYIADFVKE